MSWKTRQSGFEFIKIIAMFMIVMSHNVQCIGETQININAASTSLSSFVLSLFFYFGIWGNDIFFLCSAWFLLESRAYNKKKWFLLLIEAWTVSVIFLVISLIIRHGNIPGQIVIKSLLPTTFGNTWYITCYLLFYPLHPILNKIIRAMSKRLLFRSVLILSFLYIIINSIYRGLFYYTNFIMWFTLYFIMAYFKKYKRNFMDNVRKNIMLFLIALISGILFLVLINFLALHIPFVQNHMLYWAQLNNPFIIVMSFALLNIARKAVFRNPVINYLSSLSLLVYIAQSNLCVKTYWRPWLVSRVFAKYGSAHLLLNTMGMSAIVFLLAILFGILYKTLIMPPVKRSCFLLYKNMRNAYLAWEKKWI